MWKWDDILMDFIVGLPRSKSINDALWVIVDQLTKSACFIPMHFCWEMELLACGYIKYVVRFHGVPHSLVSDWDTNYLSHYKKTLQYAIGTMLLYSTSFHPQRDGQTEITNKIFEDMLRAISMHWQGSWVDHLDLVEFLITIVTMQKFKWFLLKHCMGVAAVVRSFGMISLKLLLWDQILLPQVTKQVKLIRDKIKVAQDHQKSYIDLKRCPVEYKVGDRVLLRVLPVHGVVRFGGRGKLSPRFIGPYEIMGRVCKMDYP